MEKKLFEILACPLCHRNLEIRKKGFFCSACQRMYPLKLGIVDFRV